MHIQVTEQDVAAGKPGDMNYCAIALAVKRLGFKYCEVGEMTLWFSKRNVHSLLDCEYKVYLPVEAQDFIKRFDKGDVVQPFQFDTL